jgi:hypothetical protein
MGFDPAWFAGVITSGEVTHARLSARPDAWWASLGRRCLHFTWAARGAISLEGLGLEVVTDPQQVRCRRSMPLPHSLSPLCVGFPLPERCCACMDAPYPQARCGLVRGVHAGAAAFREREADAQRARCGLVYKSMRH